MRAIVLVALLALFACTFTVAQETAVADAPRFAEQEDAATLAEQEAEYNAMVSGESEEEEADETDEVDAEAEEEVDEADEAEEEAEDEAEVDEADETEAEEEEAVEEEADEEADAEDEVDEQNEEEAEESSENTDYVLAELKDNAVMTGFMEMIAKFVPTAARSAEHMVHSLSSHQQAAAEQQYAVGYAHGHSDAAIIKADHTDSDETDVDEEDTETDSDEASFVEDGSKAEHPVYTAQYYAGYPSVAGVYYQPHYPTPAPPQLPTWLPPPPYITPVETKAKDGGGDDGF